MSGIMQAANAILSAAERRLEAIAHNTANISTPGYQRLVSFQSLLTQQSNGADLPLIGIRADERAGSMVSTGNPLDLALASRGVFMVRDGEHYHATRGGSFRRDESGRVVDAVGRVLQQSGGGDLIIDSEAVRISDEGLVLVDGQAMGRIGVFESDASPDIGAAAEAPFNDVDDVDDPVVRQGMIEQSNVQLADEMTAMMTISRSAEGGARLVQTYDELIGRVFTTFGQAAR